MSEAKALVNARVSRILYTCQTLDPADGYSYRFDLSTSIDELKVTIYHHTPGKSIKRLKYQATLDLTCADVMEDFRELEEVLLAFSRKKASV